jgi:hypothetical protein
MNLSHSHNISVESIPSIYYSLRAGLYNSKSVYRQVDPSVRIIVLPSYNSEVWEEDGTHITIVNQAIPPINDSYSSLAPRSNVLVMADDFFNFNSETASYESTNSNTYMVWNGYLVKAVMIPSGSILKLRSSKCLNKNHDGNRYWYVENSSDF